MNSKALYRERLSLIRKVIHLAAVDRIQIIQAASAISAGGGICP